jgi:hypothetical protein
MFFFMNLYNIENVDFATGLSSGNHGLEPKLFYNLLILNRTIFVGSDQQNTVLKRLDPKKVPVYIVTFCSFLNLLWSG